MCKLSSLESEVVCYLRLLPIVDRCGLRDLCRQRVGLVVSETRAAALAKCQSSFFC